MKTTHESTEIAVLDRRAASALAVQEPAGAELAPSPAALVHLALTRGADPATLERLMDLQQRWEAGDARKAYTRAMAAFRATVPIIRKDKHVEAGAVKFDHATLGEIVAVVGPLLAAQGLSHSWHPATTPDMITVVTRVTHVAGHFEEITLSGPPDNGPGRNKMQSIASSISYLERYGIGALLGLATAKDTDGATPRAPRDAPSPQTDHDRRVAAAVARWTATFGVVQCDLELYLGSADGLGEGAPPKPAHAWAEADFSELTKLWKTISSIPAEDRKATICAMFSLPSSALEG
jgi:hypothetical protein